MSKETWKTIALVSLGVAAVSVVVAKIYITSAGNAIGAVNMTLKALEEQELIQNVVYFK